VLGKGSMGVVYEAFDPKLKRRVAIKTIRRNPLDDQAAKDYSARFVREAQAAARLSHPNIVQIHDFGEQDDLAYLVMEFIRGKELQRCFDARERFELKVAAGIMRELCDALDFAHRAGVVHRDVKPANVMLDLQGHVKLTDFGVARVADQTRSRITQGDTLVVGTPAYMSPEQIGGGAVDGRSDVFSAGVVLYQLLTGELPFAGGGAWTIAKKIMQEQPAPPSSINTSISPRLDVVVNKALAKNPEQRYQSAGALSSALEQAAEDRRKTGKPLTASQRPIALVGALGLALAAAVGAGVWYAMKEDAPAPQPEPPAIAAPTSAEPTVTEPAVAKAPTTTSQTAVERTPAPTATAPAADKSEVAAAIAPHGGMPRLGDSWTYRLTQIDRKDDLRLQRYSVSVAAVSESVTTERYALEGGLSGRARHGRGAYLAPLGPALFSPYLAVFEELSPGEKLASIAVREGACPPEYMCSATGRVEGREQVEVPAGRFDAIKVSVEQLWRAGSASGGSQAAQMNGGRMLTIWYAPKARRAVKYSSRPTIGELPPFEVNFDLELTGYQLK
jgi:tRNA A-37 threonylcarbamoyl transferase component Bud32